ncbi:unnamed protein product [Pedinophyceae sp. YPF-701]|nr:unnamed protein product [Pedinophyceae sp. YPF-701]
MRGAKPRVSAVLGWVCAAFFAGLWLYDAGAGEQCSAGKLAAVMRAPKDLRMDWSALGTSSSQPVRATNFLAPAMHYNHDPAITALSPWQGNVPCDGVANWVGVVTEISTFCLVKDDHGFAYGPWYLLDEEEGPPFKAGPFTHQWNVYQQKHQDCYQALQTIKDSGCDDHYAVKTDYPGVDEEYWETAAVLRAVVDVPAEADAMHMIELGAGWGTWTSAAAVALRRLRGPQGPAFFGTAFEVDPSSLARLERHMQRNGIPAFRGAAAAAAFDTPPERGEARVKVVERLLDNLADAFDELADGAIVDVFHMDCQGCEFVLFDPKDRALIEAFRARVRTAVIGTHSHQEWYHQIPGTHHSDVTRFFHEAGFRVRTDIDNYGLECQPRYTDMGPTVICDGVLVAHGPLSAHFEEEFAPYETWRTLRTP